MTSIAEQNVRFVVLNTVQGLAIVCLNNLCLLCIIRKHLYSTENKYIFISHLAVSYLLVSVSLIGHGPFLYIDYQMSFTVIVAIFSFSTVCAVYNLLMLTIDQNH